MVLLKNFINIFFVPELRKKLFFTLGVLIVYRLGSHIPVVGVDVAALKNLLDQTTGLGGLLGYLDLFSGGALQHCTLFALGIMPYITASITMQMLGVAVPYLEQLLKEGEYGRKVVNQYTRYLALIVSVGQSFGFALLLERQGLVLQPGWGFRIMLVLLLSVSALFVMWLSEQISLFGLGNGSSMIIAAGIIANFPSYFIKTWYHVQQGHMELPVALLIVAIFIVITACIVFLEKGERKIPVQYSRRIVGHRIYGGQSSYIPFKINTVGVMPVIFANSVLNMPMFIAAMLAGRFAFFKWLSESLSSTGMLYNVVEFCLIIFFSFFYTALVYNPEELAENIRKSGGFIPGIRPGKKTAEFFYYILTRVGLIGAIYLATLALFPNIMRMLISMPFVIGGTSLLIVVGVSLDTAAQIESYLIEHRYEGFLTSGRLRGRSSR
ncbi:preprotein translocase subunit SecY [Candidatus Dependentiae bacterium]|nr:preprotein translocase subunit SecY [Candidatus Dependentiae bacterium]